MPDPYIGITDFVSFEQVEKTFEVYQDNGELGFEHQLHVGVMMSHKTLRGLPTRWADVFPPKECIAPIFGNLETMNCLHYVDSEETDLLNSLVDAIGWGGDGLSALQLDGMVWPSPTVIDKARLASGKPFVDIILQLGGRAFEEANNDPREVVERLRDYKGVVQYVLLDKSMGRGLGMDADWLLPFARAIRDEFPVLGLAAAGGLGPESMNLVMPLVEEFPDLSIDAQSRLRPSNNALDPIDWSMAWSYLIQAMHLFL